MQKEFFYGQIGGVGASSRAYTLVAEYSSGDGEGRSFLDLHGFADSKKSLVA